MMRAYSTAHCPRIYLMVTMITLLAFSSLLASCAITPRAQLYNSHKAITLLAGEIGRARADRLISDEQRHEYLNELEEAHGHLYLAEQLIIAEEAGAPLDHGDNWQDRLNRARVLLRGVEVYLQEAHHHASH